MKAQFIVVGGKTYRSVDEMPLDVRQKYERAMSVLGDANNDQNPDALESLKIFADRNKNGTPDLLENITLGNTVVNNTKIIVDGKEFNGVENLPPEVRARYEQAMKKLDANENGIPDFIEEMINTTNQTANVPTSLGAEATLHSPTIDTTFSASPLQDKTLPADSVITPDTSNGWMVMLAGILVLLLCVTGAAGAWYFFLR